MAFTHRNIPPILSALHQVGARVPIVPSSLTMRTPCPSRGGRVHPPTPSEIVRPDDAATWAQDRAPECAAGPIWVTVGFYAFT